jgi:tyrosinase
VAVTVEVTVNGSADPASRYLTWTPYPAQVRLVSGDDATGPVTVLLRNAAGNVGRLAFRADPTEDGEPETKAELPVDGSPVDVLLSGEFMAPSVDDGDAVLEAVVDGEMVAQVPFMVRIRKDAETLTDAERDRFVSAFAVLNNRGLGTFRGFHAMHTEDTNDEAHGLDAFLPWHRAYLLDLERELQLIDPAVTLPYWRFDQPAPRLFSPDFMGAPSGAPSALGGPPPVLSAANPLRSWTINGAPWVDRHPRFADPRGSAASPQPGRTVLAEQTLLAFAAQQDLPYAFEDVAGVPDEEQEIGFRDILEGNPHGAAHVSFAGYIRAPGTAAGDPLFFLLHCNVDRIWAQWQWHEGRFDGTDVATYFYRGAAGDPVQTRIGHNLLDTMWPWNGETGGMRPVTAPRQPLLASRVVAGPPPTPTVGDLIDFQGQAEGRPPCGFDYDDVPFEKRPHP